MVLRRIGLLDALTAPLRAFFSPLKYFSWLRTALSEYGLYARAMITVGSWIMASFLAFILITIILSVRSAVSLHPLSFFLSPLHALLYSTVFPVIPVVIDSILIMISILPFERERELLDVFAIRASSLLPYTFRVVVLAFEDKLAIKSLITVGLSNLSILFLLLGVLLTVIGLRRTMGVSWPGAVLGGLVPAVYKLAALLL